jgi:hypothetical protein
MVAQPADSMYITDAYVACVVKKVDGALPPAAKTAATPAPVAPAPATAGSPYAGWGWRAALAPATLAIAPIIL